MQVHVPVPVSKWTEAGAPRRKLIICPSSLKAAQHSCQYCSPRSLGRSFTCSNASGVAAAGSRGCSNAMANTCRVRKYSSSRILRTIMALSPLGAYCEKSIPDSPQNCHTFSAGSLSTGSPAADAECSPWPEPSFLGRGPGTPKRAGPPG